MAPNLQPVLQNDKALLSPLVEADFEALYAVASDPKIWEQHPNKDRWQREVFRNFFDGVLQSGGAFRVVDKRSGEVVGSTRFYDYKAEEASVFIGYTFYARRCWSGAFNPSVKALMLDYVFGFVNTVYFHIGAQNLRSQMAITRLGAEKIREEEISYYGEASRLNFLYAITSEGWKAIQQLQS